MVDNNVTSTTTDRMLKVRPLSDSLMTNCVQLGVFHDNISINESMINYYDYHPVKHFIRGKPIRFGYKNWVATSSAGYCYSFDLYCGKSQCASVVLLCCEKLISKTELHPRQHSNFFLIFFLKMLVYRATTSIENRTKNVF